MAAGWPVNSWMGEYDTAPRRFTIMLHMLEGTIELWHGADLEHRIVLRAGDFVFIAPGVMHQPRNASMTSTVRAVVARNTAAEQESVVLRGKPALVALD